MDQAAVLFCGARIFRRAFYFTVLCSATRIFVQVQNNNTTHNTKYIGQQWPFLGQMYVFFSTFFDFSWFNIMITYYGWWMPNFWDLYWGRTAILQIEDNILLLLLLLLLLLILCHRRHRHHHRHRYRHSCATLSPMEDCRCRCHYRYRYRYCYRYRYRYR